MSGTNQDYERQTQDQSREVWGKNGESGCEDNSQSKAGTDKDSSQLSRKPKRIYGEAGARGVLSPALIGGILSLEKRKAEEALRNAEECIQWYAREKERALNWLAEITALQAELIVSDEIEASEVDFNEDLTK